MIDLYCERASNSFLAEPLNLASNVSFVLSFALSWYLAKRLKVSLPSVYFLCMLLLCIAFGSSLFHLLATPNSLLFDIIPIALFQIVYLWVYSRKVIRLSTSQAVLITIGLLASVLMARLSDAFNGSVQYFPAFFFLSCLGIFHWSRAENERGVIFIALGIFLTSLVFRSVDLIVCTEFPIGTHFLWHLLNGCFLYVLMRALIVSISNMKVKVPET
jgi:hypothetical protein